jgi:asparagine synthase (glutamine-hydrolyzing)
MCGICGILRPSGPLPGQEEEIQTMTSSLAHRGPDGQGVLVRGPAALGHARLAIIDTSSAGAQPMATQDGRLALVFNGEIYNHKELRRELADRGHVFRSASDTEVLLRAYDQWGEDCLLRLHGMFAFCVCDYSRRRLFLARDHVGIKPLFYRTGPNFFAFASELGALRALHAPQPEGSLQNVDYFLRFQYVPAPFTIFHHVYKLPPAHFLSVDFDGHQSEPRRWWRVRMNPVAEAHAAEAEEEVRERLSVAVRRSLVADVPVGLFLSGGMDSTVVAMEAARAGANLTAFSIGFAEAGAEQLNELGYAEQAARALGITLHTEVVEHASLDILPELLDHYGEPFGDASAIPTWHVSRLARSGVKTVLSGDGGDELFGGYERFLAWAGGGKWSAPRRRELWMDIKAGRLRTLRDILDGFGYGPEAWTRFITYAFYPQRKRLWRPEHRRLADTPCLPFWNSWRHARSGPGMCLPQAMDIETYLPDAVLTKVDRASMLHGLEVRPALLDRELLEACARLPESRKWNHGPAGKLVLQKILAERFPKAFVERPKQGFGIPRSQWLSPGRRGWEMLQDLLPGRGSALLDWFEPAELERHIRMQERGLDNSQHTWLLLVLGLWAARNPEISFH